MLTARTLQSMQTPLARNFESCLCCVCVRVEDPRYMSEGCTAIPNAEWRGLETLATVSYLTSHIEKMTIDEKADRKLSDRDTRFELVQQTFKKVPFHEVFLKSTYLTTFQPMVERWGPILCARFNQLHRRRSKLPLASVISCCS